VINGESPLSPKKADRHLPRTPSGRKGGEKGNQNVKKVIKDEGQGSFSERSRLKAGSKSSATEKRRRSKQTKRNAVNGTKPVYPGEGVEVGYRSDHAAFANRQTGERRIGYPEKRNIFVKRGKRETRGRDSWFLPRDGRAEGKNGEA